jgi:hypothetical protein
LVGYRGKNKKFSLSICCCCSSFYDYKNVSLEYQKLCQSTHSLASSQFFTVMYRLHGTVLYVARRIHSMATKPPKYTFPAQLQTGEETAWGNCCIQYWKWQINYWWPGCPRNHHKASICSVSHGC